MTKIRVPFLVFALLVMLGIVLIEIGSAQAAQVASYLPGFLLGSEPLPLREAAGIFPQAQQDELARLMEQSSAEIGSLRKADLSGFAVRSLAFVDGLLLFTLILMALSLFLPHIYPRYEYFHAKLQGMVTLVFSILLIIAAIPLLMLIIAKLLLMVSLLLSFPFGTLAYLIIFGRFPHGAMSAVVNLIFFLKLLFGALLLLAHPGFIKHLSFVLYVLAALAVCLIVTFLYGIVPGILVSITDAIAAIVVVVIGILLALVLAVGAVGSIVAAYKPRPLAIAKKIGRLV